MKERPILFSGPMVREILGGRKTQTRRVIKPQPKHLQVHAHSGKVIYDGANRRWCWKNLVASDCWSIGFEQELAELCPYGKPGDRLWVRESWCQKFKEDGSGWVYNLEGNLDSSCVHYRADGYQVLATDGDGFQRWNKDGTEASPWNPSIHMPRWASRIKLEIVSVRVERLNDISGDDAFAEGVPCSGYAEHDWDDDGCPTPTAKRHALALEEYEALWEFINGEGSWAENPWVWVIEFRRVDDNA